jgi:hypothetical protein
LNRQRKKKSFRQQQSPFNPQQKSSNMTMTAPVPRTNVALRYGKLVSYALLFLALCQIIVIYDTLRNNTNHEQNNNTGVPNSSSALMAKINGNVLNSYVRQGDGSSDSGKDGSSNYDEDEDEDDGDVVGEQEGEREKRRVHWLDHKHTDGKMCDYYSGSWLIPIQNFQSLPAQDIRTLEDASHQVYYSSKQDVRMSVDWLDFSVEHLSRWYKKLDMFQERHNDIAINKITGNLLRYLQNTPLGTKKLVDSASSSSSSSSSEPSLPLLHPTIAVVSAASMLNTKTPTSLKRSTDLTITTLGATVASLLRAGFGRVVCTGITEEDKLAVKETFALIAEQYADRGDWITTTEFSYVSMEEEFYKSQYNSINRPKGTVCGLQKAFRGDFNASYTEKWLGTNRDPSYWKYVYFTEPDLVLQTRPSVLPAIHTALEKGRLLMPHRIEPIVHELDLIRHDDGRVYDGTNDYLPAEGDAFLDILDLDGDTDMCCDGGNDRPSWDKKDDPTEGECTSWWWECGYTRPWEDAGIAEEIKHRRILKFTPFVKLTNGIDLVAMPGTEHERRCHPRKQTAPNEVCKRPSSSGRSFATYETEI